MRIWTQLEKCRPDPQRPLILALGNFDGVHLGHQRILKAVLDHARRRNGIPAVLTFREHPQRVLHPAEEPALLTSPQHRLFLFQERGMEVCLLLHFTLTLSKMSPEDFVKDLLVGQLQAREIHLGYNAHFGSARKGDCSLMRQLSDRLPFEFYETEPVKVEDEFVSSTLIRKAIHAGDLARSARLLGRPFSVFASVVRGSGRGKTLGFPTANLKPHSEILPPRGVYPVEVRQKMFHLRPISESHEYEYVLEPSQETWSGILNYGLRPTFGPEAGGLVPEVHLFNFTGDLYSKTVEVIFHPRLREEKFFESSQDLTRAIEKDVAEAQRYFEGSR